MGRKVFLISLLSVAVLTPIKLAAQDSGCAKRTIAVGVVDSAWNLVPNLGAANFRGKVHDHDVQILSASSDTIPRHIVVLLDASGSMTNREGWWKTEKTICQYSIRFAPPRASMAFLGFSQTILDTEGFDDDAPSLLRNLSALVKVCEQPRKGPHLTALYDAISTARGSLGVCKLGDVICVLTDGEDNKSQTTTKRVEEDLLTGQVRLFGIVMLHVVRSAMPIVEPEQLYSMIEATGGNKLLVPPARTLKPYNDMRTTTAADALDLALQRLYQQMGGFYRIEVKLPVTLDKPTKWRLEVVGAGGKPMRNVEVHYPQELMPCAKVSP